MSEKRRDSKNRVLRNGESQRQDGRYVFKYIDQNGATKFIYSWKLDKNDRVPAGKRNDLSLREKEKAVMQNLFDGIVSEGGGYTVLSLVEKYISLKTGVRLNTRAGYKTVVNILKKDPFGGRRIDKVRLSDAKAWLVQLQKKGRSYSSIHSIRGVLRPAFEMAVNDDLIRKNPFNFELVSVIVNDSVMREAITRDEERKFLKFVAEDKHYSKYYDGIFLLFKTGMRISELCGLTLSDIDLKSRTIRINHQLQRARDGHLYIIDDNFKGPETKTPAGTRTIPMTEEVYEVFARIVNARKARNVEPIVDGYTGFLFFTTWNGKTRPSVAMDWEHYFSHIVAKYNKIYKIQMPKVTPHVCRHTYCSNMARSGMNPKTLQYLMGHSDISVTLNTYTHLGLEDAQQEIRRLAQA